ncbi:Acyl-CoA ligase gloD, partial [Fulvia fulva]
AFPYEDHVPSRLGTTVYGYSLRRATYIVTSRALSLLRAVNGVPETNKVVSIFALNTIDVPTVTWATHRVGGVCSPINASYTSTEGAGLLKKANAKAIFTVQPLLEIAAKAAEIAGIRPRNERRRTITGKLSCA